MESRNLGERAVLVHDAFQGKGLGYKLMEVLIRSQNGHIVVVGGETNSMMQGWRFVYPSTASVDKWR